MDYLTTKDAAKVANLKPNELTDTVRKYGIEVERVGKTYLWTTVVAMHAAKIHGKVKRGECIHCGKPWNMADAEILATDEPADAE